MLDVLVALEVVKWLAHDLHYRSSGESFYALHLLADKIDFGSAYDDLIETYFLGMRHERPPTEKAVHALAVEKTIDLSSDTNDALLCALQCAVSDLVATIEEAKREAGLCAGVHSILDSISQTALVASGLIDRTLTKDMNDDDSGD